MAAIRTRLGEIVVAGVPVSTGVGAATFPGDGVDMEALLDRADNRLRHDKYGGKRSNPTRRAARSTRRRAYDVDGRAPKSHVEALALQLMLDERPGSHPLESDPCWRRPMLRP